MKQQMIKPDLFEVSDSKTKYSKVQALSFFHRDNVKPTKKRLKDMIKVITKHNNLMNNDPNKIENQSYTITLKCSLSNREIGYICFDSYSGYDTLNILYVNEEFRGKGFSKLLISYFENQSDKLKVVEIMNKSDKSKQLFKDFGYDHFLDEFFDPTVALVKENEAVKLMATYHKLLDEVQTKKQMRFLNAKHKVLNILQDNTLNEEYKSKLILKSLNESGLSIEEYTQYVLYEQYHNNQQIMPSYF